MAHKSDFWSGSTFPLLTYPLISVTSTLSKRLSKLASKFKPTTKVFRLPLKMSDSIPTESSSTTEFCTIESSDGVELDARIFKPSPPPRAPNATGTGGDLVVVLVHPYSILGGCQGLTKGIARGLANRGFTAVTFDTRGTGRSTGRASLTGSAEVRDVISVCQWVTQNLSANRILLVGSSAGDFMDKILL